MKVIAKTNTTWLTELSGDEDEINALCKLNHEFSNHVSGLGDMKWTSWTSPEYVIGTHIDICFALGAIHCFAELVKNFDWFNRLMTQSNQQYEPNVPKA